MPTPHQLRRSIVAIGVTASLALGASCASDGPRRAVPDAPSTTITTTVTTTAAPEGGYPVATRVETLTDPDRPTPDVEGTEIPPSPDRTLVTTFTYPDAPGPFPLIAFAHGHYGHPRKFTELFAAWAGAGFVVAAPTFPLSSDEVPGAATVFDLPSQPGDLSFVISETLRMNDDPDGFLGGRLDPARVAVAGLSLGGATVYQAAFGDCCRDERVRAVLVMDAFHPELADLDLGAGLPLMIMHAEDDPVLDYSQAETAFAAASPPRYLVTIHDDVHAQPYEDTPNPADELVIDTTTAFWRLYLSGQADAADTLATSASVQGLSTLVEDPG